MLPNPLGYNRVYVHVGEDFSYPAWWDGLRAGRSFVTNGPLLLCRANGQLPGHVFSGEEGAELQINVSAKLITQDHVPAIEIIRDGHVERSIAPAQFASGGGLGTLSFERSGWFLVRAIADNRQTFRFASTAPFYVEIGPSKKRISRESVQFFLDWVDERIDRVRKNLPDEAQLREVLDHHQQAKKFWKELAGRANAP